MSYSSQKLKLDVSYVNFQGAEESLLGGVTCGLRCPSSNLPTNFSQKSCVEIWFVLVEPFKSYRGNRQKKKITDATENNTFGKILFRAVLNTRGPNITFAGSGNKNTINNSSNNNSIIFHNNHSNSNDNNDYKKILLVIIIIITIII